jgi:hypothetical protein
MTVYGGASSLFWVGVCFDGSRNADEELQMQAATLCLRIMR